MSILFHPSVQHRNQKSVRTMSAKQRESGAERKEREHEQSGYSLSPECTAPESEVCKDGVCEAERIRGGEEGKRVRAK